MGPIMATIRAIVEMTRIALPARNVGSSLEIDSKLSYSRQIAFVADNTKDVEYPEG